MNEGSKQTVLITGGTTGIGFELAKIFAQNGYDLVIVARDMDELSAASVDLTQWGASVTMIEKDLFKRDAPFELHEEIGQRNIRIDILVNNAGQGQYGLFSNTDIHRELAIIQLNIASVVVLTKLFLLDMLKRGEGKILNVSSIASKAPGPWQSVYHGTKAFVQSFTEAIRSEVQEKGITVTALLPGATATDFFRKADMLDAKNIKDKELADPADVAKDGYEALMKGDDMVVSGFGNKVSVTMSKMMPDSAAARKVKKQQEPAKDEETDKNL